jgi:hypothetical protein
VLTEEEKKQIVSTSDLLRTLARKHYDAYRRESDSNSKLRTIAAQKSYEKYNEINKICLELDIIVVNGLE